MRDLLDLLFMRTWWSWDPNDRSWHSLLVHWFNVFEAVAWWSFGVLVLRRYLKCRRSRLEIAYAMAFFIFGLTDVQEAFSLTSWLLGIKLVNLIALWRLRKTVMKRWYPASRVY